MQAGGKRKTRYEGLVDWSESAVMPDITEQLTPCRPKKAKHITPAKDSMLYGTAQDYAQSMLDLDPTKPFRTGEECVRMHAKVPPGKRNFVALAWSDNGVIPIKSSRS